MNSQYGNGRVYIVGAGPGDPGLMTIKGLEKLKQADVVVYDRLINDDLLSYCKEECEKIFVGKESGYHPIEQEQITEILIRKAELGLSVVRLKGGNPFVFGRGSEEAIALKDAGIDFEIIPGITSGLSAPVYSGIPITHRGMITQCVLITAHESPEKDGSQVEWHKLARLKNTTLIIYMGASRIGKICDELMKHGMDPATPCGVIENGTLPKQRTITGRIDSIAQEFKAMDFHAPAIIMIGSTVAMRAQLSWFESKPLFAKRIVVSANKTQLVDLREMVYDMGGEILSLPCYENDSMPYGSEYRRSDGQGLPSGSAGPAFTTVSADILDDVVEDIRNKGADAFIFATTSAVEHFFGVFGYESASKLLDRGKSISLSHEAADSLVDRNIRFVNVPSAGSAEGLRELIIKLFSVK